MAWFCGGCSARPRRKASSPSRSASSAIRRRAAKRRAPSSQEVTKLKADAAKFARIGEQRSSQRLGDTTEMEATNALKIARPERKIKRVSFTEILRRCSALLHRARAAGNDAGAAKAKMFALFASGEGHTLLHSAFNAIPKLKEVNQELVDDVGRHINASNKLLDMQQQNLGRVFAAIDGIVSGGDDGETS